MPVVFNQIYEYQGKRYEVWGFVKMKHPDTRKWIPSILYRPEGCLGENYVREVGDFQNTFRFVESRQVT